MAGLSFITGAEPFASRCIEQVYPIHLRTKVQPAAARCVRYLAELYSSKARRRRAGQNLLASAVRQQPALQHGHRPTPSNIAILTTQSPALAPVENLQQSFQRFCYPQETGPGQSRRAQAVSCVASEADYYAIESGAKPGPDTLPLSPFAPHDQGTAVNCKVLGWPCNHDSASRRREKILVGRQLVTMV